MSTQVSPILTERRWRRSPDGKPDRRGSAATASTIVHVSAEYSPYVRTGGLGEAVAGLSVAQARAGHRVLVFVPLYRAVHTHAVELEPVTSAIELDLGTNRETVKFYRDESLRFGPEVIFVDAPQYFDRDGLYGENGWDYADNDRRFALFSLAAVAGVSRLAPNADVIHPHDWHAALVPVFLRNDPRFSDLASTTSVVLSIHNAAFQGQFDLSALADVPAVHELLVSGIAEVYGRLNFLKAALSLTDVVVTVSPTHAKELRSEVGGFGLHESFRDLGDRLIGITNGINQRIWDPECDRAIAANYTADDLSGKAACKAALQAEYDLPLDASVPVFGMSARLAEQKGLDIILASEFVRTANAQFIFLGTGEQRYQDALRQLAEDRPTHVATQFDFTDLREHRLLGGADFLLMPSLFEPCGLTQMRAQRYGAPVVARNVGGLRDTVDPSVGFLFDAYDGEALSEALARAAQCFGDGDTLQAMRRHAMARDFSWSAAVPNYADAYRRAVGQLISAT